MSGIMIAGTHSGVGKTTLSMGIMAAISKKTEVQPYKVGPDYIDTAYHTYITKNKSRNLDSWMLTDEKVKYLYNKNLNDGKFAVVEGVMGLYDGYEIGSDIGSSSRVAKILKLPVILVVDGSGVSQSIAATILGYQHFDRDINIEGVIINKVSGQVHYQMLKKAIEMYTDVKVYGYLEKNMNINLSSRHLGLVPSCENEKLDELVDELAEKVEKTIDIDLIIDLGEKYSQVTMKDDYREEIHNFSKNRKKVDSVEEVRLAIAKDEAFNFYYHDNLDYLKERGVKLVEFSPIRDKKLPDNIDGLLFGGGFPEVFAKKLMDNREIRNNIKTALIKGVPYIAECGGLMYLCKSIKDFDGSDTEMVGWFDAEAEMTSRLQRFGYAILEIDEECIYGNVGQKIRIHEFHRSKVQTNIKPIYTITKSKKDGTHKEWKCGYKQGNGVGAYAHLHYYSNEKFADNFIKNMREYKSFKGEKDERI